MKNFSFRISFVFMFIFFLLCGCSSLSTTKAKSQGFKQDGKFISMVKTTIQTYSDMQSYRITYWSGGVKTVANVVLPKVGGAYPLYVWLHGGYILPTDDKHVTTVDSTNVISTLGLQNSEEGFITLMPLYRGYGKSEGTVQGLKGNSIDTENAIKALTNYLNSKKNGPHVKKGHLYVWGASMGGGVALKLASERQDIAEVIALSPFVGWDITGSWDKQHNINDFQDAESLFGKFNPKNSTYQEQSIDFTKITAPVLLIQGTKDPYTPWQTVQTFYDKMKSANKNVTFKLIKDGNHGLTNKQDEYNHAFQVFFIKYYSD